MFLPGLKSGLKELSIQNKILVINLTVTAIALLFAVVMSIASDYVSKRNYLVENLLVQAKMVGKNSSVALVFNDNNAAEDILKSFSESPAVRIATVYDVNNNVLASYLKDDQEAVMNDVHILDISNSAGRKVISSESFFENKVGIVQEISHNNSQIGKLYLQADISNLHSDSINHFLYTSFVAFLSLIIASILFLKLRKRITGPLQLLTDLMETVIKESDYSVRAKINSNDEIGVLADGFNEMLAHIQVNDEKLEHELSERYKAEKHLDKLAYYDVITDLPNRHFFQEHLDRAVEHAVKTNQLMALLFLDLDNFKTVNDTAGHNTGDLLLKQASSRLSNVLRLGDYICRIGGDEFAIIIENIKDIKDVSKVTGKCIECLSKPFVFDDHKFFVGVSIGVSVCPDDAVNANELLVSADVAMYEAKLNGKNNYKFFNKEMNEVNSLKYQLESDLRYAIKHKQMEIYYQPQVDSNTGAISGVEALMRWNHPDKGTVFPDKFIPIAEENGMILQLGEWLLNTVCLHRKKLISSGLDKISISINVSVLQIRDDSFIGTVSRALKKFDLEPGFLEIELTESILMNNSEQVIDKVRQLHDMGVQIAIDDFGSGFSSMNYLKSLPVNKIKIDRSFVAGLSQGSEDKAITKAIVAMSHGMGISVVAEGVEHQEQADYLCSYQCNVLQGYYFYRPMMFGDLLRLDEKEFIESEK